MIKIRQFSLSDFPDVMKTGSVSFPPGVSYSKNYFEKYFKKYPEGFVVAECKGKFAGYALSQLKKNGAEFISLAVKPSFRKKGIGTKLSRYLINHFKKKGVKNIRLNIRTKNKIAASFYGNLGFKILKKIEKYYKNGDDTYLMENNLGE